jgi:capsular polysaccharide biosynthesis protein
MDLLSIVQTLWRRKLFAIPVILLTLIGGIYVIKVKPPVYESSASVLLITPNPPTPAQIAADPKLRKINTNNPYIDYGDLQIVGDAVIELVTSDAAQPALISAGVDPRYTLSLSDDVGDPPIIEITGVGSTPQQAIHSAGVLAQVSTEDLYQLQKQQGVNHLYMIQATDLVRPTQATLSDSGKLRSLIAVLGLGTLLLFIVISVTDAVDKRRARTARALPNDDISAKLQPEDREAELEPRRRRYSAKSMSPEAARARRESVRR